MFLGTASNFKICTFGFGRRSHIPNNKEPQTKLRQKKKLFFLHLSGWKVYLSRNFLSDISILSNFSICLHFCWNEILYWEDQYFSIFSYIFIYIHSLFLHPAIWVHTDPYGSIWAHMAQGPSSVSNIYYYYLFFRKRACPLCWQKNCRTNKPFFQKYADQTVNMKDINLVRGSFLCVKISGRSCFKSANLEISGMAKYLVIILFQQKFTF